MTGKSSLPKFLSGSVSSLALPNCTTNWRQEISQRWGPVPEFIASRSQTSVTDCWKHYRAHLRKDIKSSSDNFSLSLSWGFCFEDWLKCFSLSLTCGGKRRVLEATQQCTQGLVQWAALPVTRKKMPSELADHRVQDTVQHLSHPIWLTFIPQELVIGCLCLSALTLDSFFLYILLSFLPFSSPGVLSPDSTSGSTARSCWIWPSNSLLILEHQEE